RQGEVERHPELAGPGEQARGEQWAEPRGREELESIGERMEAPAPDDERAPEAVVRPHQPVLDPEPAAESERPRLLREEGVGPALDDEAIAPLRRDRAAQAILGLKHGEVEAPPALPGEFARPVRRGEPGDAAPDDHELHGRRPRARFTRSASNA